MISNFKIFIYLKEKIQKEEFFRFLIVGGIAFFIDLSAYYLLSAFLSIFFAKYFAFILATIFTFVCNNYWTFSYKSITIKVLLKFFLFYIFSAAVNAYVNKGLFQLTNHKLFSFLCATGANLLINFFGLKKIVFKSKE